MKEASLQLHTAPITEGRLNWVDYAKGIGIFLVVLGHVVRGLVNSSVLEKSALLNFVDDWIYAFHMPLFFFISGLFIQNSLKKPFGEFLSDKVFTIAYPYFLWSIIQGIFQTIGGYYTNNLFSILNIWRIIYEPLLQFWFLYVLFTIVLVYRIFYQIKLSSGFFLIFSILIYCCYILNISFGDWGILYIFRNNVIYFALGASIGVTKLTSVVTNTKNTTLLLMMLGGYLLVGLSVPMQINENPTSIPIVAIIGIASSLALAVLLNNLDILKSVKKWGKFSLEIFVAHTIASSFLRIILHKFFSFTEPITHLILGTIIGLYAPIFLSFTCSKIGFQYMFTLKHWKNKNISKLHKL